MIFQSLEKRTLTGFFWIQKSSNEVVPWFMLSSIKIDWTGQFSLVHVPVHRWTDECRMGHTGPFEISMFVCHIYQGTRSHLDPYVLAVNRNADHLFMDGPINFFSVKCFLVAPPTTITNAMFNAFTLMSISLKVTFTFHNVVTASSQVVIHHLVTWVFLCSKYV